MPGLLGLVRTLLIRSVLSTDPDYLDREAATATTD
jgi:hypothetical protein